MTLPYFMEMSNIHKRIKNHINPFSDIIKGNIYFNAHFIDNIHSKYISGTALSRGNMFKPSQLDPRGFKPNQMSI